MFFGRKRFSYLSMVFLYLKLVPSMAITKLIYNLISAALPTVNIFLTATFIDEAIRVAENDGRILNVLFPLLGIIGIQLFQYFVGVIVSLLGRKASNKLNSTVLLEVVERKANVKYKYYEDQNSVDTMDRAMNGFSSKIQGFFDHFFAAFAVISQIVGFIAVLGMQLWWASVVFVLAAIPSFVTSYHFGKKRYDVDKEMSKVDRRAWYISGVLRGRETVDERYLYQYTREMDEKYKRNYEKARTERERVTRHLWINTTVSGSLVFLSGIVTVGVLIPQLFNLSGTSALQIGMFISLVNALFGLSRQMQDTIPDYINTFRYQFEYLKDLNKFLLFETEECATCLPAAAFENLETVEFRNVSFRYPDCEPYVLRNFNLKLYSGKHYAIVGINGAGKTTIIKLLTGLYDDYEGEVLINGKELRTLDLSVRKALVSVVYQDFCRYPLDFYHNVSIGNINKMDDRDRVERAVDVMGLSTLLKKLPEGIKTPVSKIYENGIDLSGGEWQRIALSRLLVSNALLKILDEPTSALDPISESRLYQQFHTISKQSSTKKDITLFISHRLGSTKLADEIIVIDNGRVVEMGAFDNLLSKDGLYAEMFRSQAQWYREEREVTNEEK